MSACLYASVVCITTVIAHQLAYIDKNPKNILKPSNNICYDDK